jgi:hypothetical protein
MPISVITTDSLLAIDIGTTTTRAQFFDVVDGRYRFLASGSAVTTAGAPFNDIGEGVHKAIGQLQDVTGRLLLRNDDSLITPSAPDGTGVDKLVLTLSAGPPLRVLAVGLLDDISVESARRLAHSTYAEVVETLSLNDSRKQNDRIDTILKVRPDLIIIAGGTEGGASQSIRKLLEVVALACYLLPDTLKPQVLYAGNYKMQREARSALESITPLHIAPNIHPTLEVEQLDAAQVELAQIYRQVRSLQIMGVSELHSWADGGMVPTATAFGRIIRFLSRVYDPTKGVLGIDIGASATTLAAAFGGTLISEVYTNLGLGSDPSHLLRLTKLEGITRWLSVDLPGSAVLDYVYNKSLYPASLPATTDDLALEQALARQIIRMAVMRTAVRFPSSARGSGAGLLPWVEPIMATGSVLTQAPTPGQSLLTLLDGLQPTGVTTVVLDQNNLAATLGVAANVNPILSVQVLESSSFLNLGTVISPVGNTRPGMPILRLTATFEDGNETKMEVKNGTLEVLPVPMGQSVNLRLQPLHRFDIGMGGAGRGGRLRVVGGALGVIIDARGRPLELHPDVGRRRELFKKWLWTLGN